MSAVSARSWIDGGGEAAPTSGDPSPMAWPKQQVEASEAILAANLQALGLCCSATKQRVMDATSADSAFVLSRDGLLTGVYRGRQLASKISAKQEALKFAEGIDLIEHGCVVVRGMGTGHHAAAVFEMSKGRCGVVVYEPDVSLLRAVLERIDYSAALATGRFAIVTTPQQAEVAEALSAMEGLCGIGIHVADHAPSLARWRDDQTMMQGASAFLDAVQAAVSAIRLTLMTLFKHDELTVRNMIQNVDHYALCDGVQQYAGLFGPGRTEPIDQDQPANVKRAARPAVVVSAGPSLARTIEHLARPGVRDRLLIVATQTVLKALLARGIKPHLVCALDHHELSARFYEGLSKEELEGVKLLFEPKVNPAVPAAFAGEKRVCEAQVLDLMLGEELARPTGRITGGSTVAHLCYETARFMGCDPVLLIGQDLGFSDGTYYSSGAAIHEVWGIEVNRFQSLESMEWMRIKRNAGILRKAIDVHGKPMYTDEQMHGYLQHFERLFLQDQRAGLTTTDAGGGGIAKAGTMTREFGQVIDELLQQPAPQRTIAEAMTLADQAVAMRDVASGVSAAGRLSKVKARLTLIGRQAQQLSEMSRQSKDILIEIREHYADSARVERLVEKLDQIRRRYEILRPAADLMHVINSAGTFRRHKADRALAMAAELSVEQRERRQIDRDLLNVELLGEATDRLKRLMDGALLMLAGGRRITREQAGDEGDAARESTDDKGGAEATAHRPTSLVAGVISVMQRDWMGRHRDLASLRLGDETTTLWSLRRMLAATGLHEVVAVTDVPGFVSQQASLLPESQRTRVRIIDSRSLHDEADDTLRQWPTARLVSARAWAKHAWRGGLHGLTIWDEIFCAGLSHRMLLRLLEQEGLDAALIGSCDWPMMDPELLSDLVRRHQDHPREQPMTFAASGAGTCGLLLSKDTLHKLITAEAEMRGTFGIPLAYGPLRAMPDLLGESCCAPVRPELRQVITRMSAQTTDECQMLEEAITRAGLVLSAEMPSAQACQAVNRWMQETALAGNTQPYGLEIELHVDDAQPLNVQPRLQRRTIRHTPVEQVLCSIAGVQASEHGKPLGCVTIISRGTLHPHLEELTHAIRNMGATAICVQTDLLSEHESDIARLAACGAEVIAVEMIADDPAHFASITGLDGAVLTTIKNRVQQLIDLSRRGQGSLHHVVPILPRCDATIGLYDEWFDRAILAAGWACITPRSGPMKPGERIAPLAEPPIVQWRRFAFHRVIDAQGAIHRPPAPSRLLPGMQRVDADSRGPAHA